MFVGIVGYLVRFSARVEAAVAVQIALNESMNILFVFTDYPLPTSFAHFEHHIRETDIIEVTPNSPAFIGLGLHREQSLMQIEVAPNSGFAHISILSVCLVGIVVGEANSLQLELHLRW